MIRHIHQSNLIEGIDDPESDAQSLLAWQWLQKQDYLSHYIICEVQRAITQTQDTLTDEQRGRYRNVWVRVGDSVPPTPFQVQGRMDNWLMDYKAHTPLANHIKFELIHPFFDGNGRTGRMLMWWQQIKEGKPPTLFKNSEKFDKYYPLFDT